jgi:hypothetical protein
MTDRNFRKVKNIEKDLQKYYRDYFERNATKFIWKWPYKMDDLNATFINEGEEYTLIGQISEATFFLKKTEDESHWFVAGHIFQDKFTKK